MASIFYHKYRKTLFSAGKAALFLSAVYGVEKFCHKQTDGFCLANISSPPRVSKVLPCTLLCDEEMEEADKLLSQPFHYLCKGGQCYVFASEDGKAVLKFFKQQHRHLPWLVDIAPLPSSIARIRDRKREEKKLQKEREEASYCLAFDALREETALLLCQFRMEKPQAAYRAPLNKRVVIYDKLRIAHEIDLADFEFLLQRRAEMPFPYLKMLIETNERAAAKEALLSLFQLMRSKAEKKIADFDPNLSKNFGFIDGHAVQFDIGRFERGAPEIALFVKKQQEFQQWLRDQDPELATLFVEQYNQLIQFYESKTH